MSKSITMGSLFSGFGGFEVAAQWHGAKVLWQSEIEPWAVELLKKHFPADWHIGLTNSKGKLLPDTAAYKGYGNAVSTVCAEYPIANIVEILKEAQDADNRDN